MSSTRRDLLRTIPALVGAAAGGRWLPRVLAQTAMPEPRLRMMSGAAAAGLDFLLRNNAAGRKYQVETLPGGLGVIDFDSDGWPDLFCTNGASLPSLVKTGPQYWNRLYKNNRDGTFSDVTAKAGLQGEGYSMGVAVGDYNNDGHEDLFVAGVHANHLYRNNGDGAFTDVTREAGLSGPGSLGRPAWSVGACWIDYDNDGRLDLFVAGGGLDVEDAHSNRIFLNHGGHFEDVTDAMGSDFSRPALHRGVVFADFDRDGRMDAAVTALNSPIELWWNRGTQANPVHHWLQLRLTGRKSNRSAIGAEVRCHVGGRLQLRTVSGSMGYGSTSDLTVHFGLGEATRAELEIRWPSGRLQALGGVAPDQRLNLTEPAD